MTPTAELSADQSTLTFSFPLAIRRHGGRKQVVSPTGALERAPDVRFRVMTQGGSPVR